MDEVLELNRVFSVYCIPYSKEGSGRNACWLAGWLTEGCTVGCLCKINNGKVEEKSTDKQVDGENYRDFMTTKRPQIRNGVLVCMPGDPV